MPWEHADRKRKIPTKKMIIGSEIFLLIPSLHLKWKICFRVQSLSMYISWCNLVDLNLISFVGGIASLTTMTSRKCDVIHLYIRSWTESLSSGCRTAFLEWCLLLFFVSSKTWHNLRLWCSGMVLTVDVLRIWFCFCTLVKIVNVSIYSERPTGFVLGECFVSVQTVVLKTEEPEKGLENVDRLFFHFYLYFCHGCSFLSQH